MTENAKQKKLIRRLAMAKGISYMTARLELGEIPREVRISYVERVEQQVKEGRLLEEVRFLCPGCTKQCIVGFTAEGHPAVMHPIPMCTRFDAIDLNDHMSLTEFLKDARLKAHHWN